MIGCATFRIKFSAANSLRMQHSLVKELLRFVEAEVCSAEKHLPFYLVHIGRSLVDLVLRLCETISETGGASPSVEQPLGAGICHKVWEGSFARCILHLLYMDQRKYDIIWFCKNIIEILVPSMVHVCMPTR